MLNHIRKIVLMGFGNIGQALSPLLREHFPTTPVQVLDERMAPDQVAIAQAHGWHWARVRITQAEHCVLLAEHAPPGTLLINIATSISSHDVIAWAHQHGVFYLDTCIDPWSYQDGELNSAANTNYQMRQRVLELAMRLQAPAHGPRPGPTAVVAHGANPGLVSVLVKEGLSAMAREHLAACPQPLKQADWAALACRLGVRVIQVSERDTQHGGPARQADEFVNTWSVDGFVAEALQPIEMGWGSHEAHGPWASQACHHREGSGAGVYFAHLGVQAQVRSWAPLAGAFTGRLISHNEALSLAEYLSAPQADGSTYRPTVYYAYHPCDEAMASLSLLDDGHRKGVKQQRVLKEELQGGIDELGVLLLSDQHPGLWIGSQLSLAQARAIAPHNNATSLQVVGSMLAAIEWIDHQPARGVIESEALDHEFILARARRCWEPLVKVHTHWHPQGDASLGWTLDHFMTVR
jgi:homospermidine synthase